MRAKTDLIAALVLSGLVAIGILLTLQIDLSFSRGMNLFTGPRGYPGLVLGLMLLLGLALIFHALRHRHGEQAPATQVDPGSEEEPAHRIEAAVAYAALVLFVLVLEPLGYILAMLPLLMVIARLSGARRWAVAALVSVALLLVCLIAFRYGLDTVLPEGLFGIDMVL